MSTKRPRQEEGNSEKKRRRSEPKEDRRPAWKRAQDLPAFLDASASVSATTFGARRLPEIKALWNKAVSQSNQMIPSEESLRSSGSKTSSRHLRRRTTSHNSRKRHRFPDAGNQDRPTRENLSRRCARKNKSALTGIHQKWWKVKIKNESTHQENETEKDNIEENPNQEQSDKEDTITYWMTTHLWHAKRFHMSDLWGWQVPLAHTNRGAKAALRLIREGKTLLQDATWKMAQPIHFFAPSIEQQETLVATIRRICPEFQLNLSGIAATASTCTGQGMIYALDQFPKNAIGPVTWLVSSIRPLMGSPVQSANAKHCYFYFWVHPSIQADVWNEFKALQDEIIENAASPVVIQNLQLGFQRDNIGMACLQLRGSSATNTLLEAVADPTTMSDMDSWCRAGNKSILEDNKLHVHVPHGTVIPAYVSCDSLSPNGTLGKDASVNAWITGNSALLVSRCHRDPVNLPQNAPAMGWDVLCDASIAKDLFLRLILTGGACPIGVVEEAYNDLECEPPLANVFPRDYPETQQGRDYWQHGAAGKSCEDLLILRMCLEEGEGGGRIPIPLTNKRVRSPPVKQQQIPKVSAQHLCKIDWNHLVTAWSEEERIDSNDEQDPADSEVVVMRGMFGRPLVDALQGSGIIPFQDDPSQSTRRKRRRSKQPNEICRVLPLAPEDAEKHLATCTALLQSLSLPAVVACHLQIVGSGNVSPGAEIHSCEGQGSSRLLGYTTAGCFSVARGTSHGVGVVGAANLLRAILWAASSSQQSLQALAVVGRHRNGNDKREIHLQVEIKTKQLHRKATLALLL